MEEINDEREKILKLSFMCLQTISANLERFNLAFSTTDDTELQKGLLYLQKKYSPYLIQAAREVPSSSRKLDQSYFQFLLNKYMNAINMGIFFESDWPAVIERMREIGRVFRKVRFDLDRAFKDSPRTKDAINFVDNILRFFPNVEILVLGEFCEDSTLAVIAKYCLQLKILVLAKCYVTDEGLKLLCPTMSEQKRGSVQYPNLKYFALSQTEHVDAGLAHLLENMTSLEVILHPNLQNILHNLYMSDQVGRKYNLKIFHYSEMVPYISAPPLKDMLTVIRDTCPEIKRFIMSIEEDHYWSNIDFPDLECLTIYGRGRTYNINNFLQDRGRIMRKLCLYHCSCSVDILLDSCTQLESLSLSFVEFLPFQPGSNPLSNLYELILDCFNFQTERINRKESIINLLRICNSKKCNETLKLLKLRWCFIDTEFLLSLVNTCSNLKDVAIVSCSISRDAVKELRLLKVNVIFTTDALTPVNWKEIASSSANFREVILETYPVYAEKCSYDTNL